MVECRRQGGISLHRDPESSDVGFQRQLWEVAGRRSFLNALRLRAVCTWSEDAVGHRLDLGQEGGELQLLLTGDDCSFICYSFLKIFIFTLFYFTIFLVATFSGSIVPVRYITILAECFPKVCPVLLFKRHNVRLRADTKRDII